MPVCLTARRLLMLEREDTASSCATKNASRGMSDSRSSLSGSTTSPRKVRFLSLSLFFASAARPLSSLTSTVPGWGLLRLLDPKGKETEGMLAVRVTVKEQEKEEGKREWLGRKFKELMK